MGIEDPEISTGKICIKSTLAWILNPRRAGLTVSNCSNNARKLTVEQDQNDEEVIAFLGQLLAPPSLKGDVGGQLEQL
ncbi:MAG: hypothetical protein ACMG6E_03445 [Candidatus Roizmanbacteria bacterium]